MIEGNRKYIRCLYAYNKIDTITIEEVRVRASRGPQAFLFLPASVPAHAPPPPQKKWWPTNALSSHSPSMA